MSQLSLPDFIVLSGFFVVMLVVGIVAFRASRSVDDFFKGGGQVPWWLSAVSFYMSSFSAFGFITYSALAYKFGFTAVTLYWVTVPAVVVSALWLAARWRRAEIGSPIEYLETRYGLVMRQTFAWQGVPVKVVDDALKLVAIAAFLSVSLDLNTTWCILVAGLTLLAYTFFGGLWGVLITDFVQFAVMVVGVAMLLPLALIRVGGFHGLAEGSPEGFFHLMGGEYTWFYWISLALLITLAWSSVNWALIQRYTCVPTVADARRVGLSVAILNIVTPPLMFLPAMAARQFLGDVDNTAEVYPMLCVALLPAGLLGLIVAAMFAATMSMLSSDFNVVANVLTVDVYHRVLRPAAGAKELRWIARVATAVVGFVSIGLAIVLAETDGEGLFKAMVKVFGVATAPVAVPMILGLLTSRIGQWAGMIGFGIGFGAGLGASLLINEPIVIAGERLAPEIMVLWVSLIATAVGTGIGVVLVPPTTAEEDRAKVFVSRLSGKAVETALTTDGNKNVSGIQEATKNKDSSIARTVGRLIGACLVVLGIISCVAACFNTTIVAASLNIIAGLALIVGGGVCFLVLAVVNGSGLSYERTSA